MRLRIYQAALLLIIANCALANNFTTGCKLIVPQAPKEKLEPDQEPLLISVLFQYLDISDVPSSGGSGTPYLWVYGQTVDKQGIKRGRIKQG